MSGVRVGVGSEFRLWGSGFGFSIRILTRLPHLVGHCVTALGPCVVLENLLGRLHPPDWARTRSL